MDLKKNNNIRLIAESITVIWKLLSEQQRTYLLDNISVLSFDKNEIIYEKNTTPEYIMCLLRGKVKVYMDGACGRSQIVRVVNEKSVFAFRAAFAGEKYQTEASALDKSEVCMIPLTVMNTLIDQNVTLAKFFIRKLAMLLGEADILTVNLTQKRIRARLAESILTLKEKYGLEEDGTTLNIYLSREDLANMSNMTTSNAIRTLSAFAQEKMIGIDGRKINILNKEELRRTASMG